MKRKHYLWLGVVIGICAVAISPVCFPYNIPLVVLGGGLIGWNIVE